MMKPQFMHVLSMTLAASTLVAAGCSPQDATSSGEQPSTGQDRAASIKSFTQPQTLLDGNSIPKFIDPLPTFVGGRVNASVT
jgi:hypothetical protein